MTSFAKISIWLVLVSIYLIFNSINANIIPTKYKPKNDDQLGDLLQVQLLFRHGDRTPVNFYGTDPYQNYTFPEGLGALIEKGVERMHNYGEVLKKQYSDYLETFFPRNVRAQSSPVRRVMESNLAFLAGLFPPTTDWIWSNESDLARLWQPIAVETYSPESAYMLGEHAPCPEADKMSDQIDSLARVTQLFTLHHELLTKLTKDTQSELTKLKPVGDLYDTLFCEQNYFGDSFQVPNWLDTDTIEKLKLFREMQFSIFGDLPENFLRLKAGPFLKDMIENMNATLNDETGKIDGENRQVLTYSTHDRVLAIILHSLGLFKEQPSYGSGLIIELRGNAQQVASSAASVHLYYANVTDQNNIYALPLNESTIFAQLCPNSFCSFQNFAASLQRFIPDDIEVECGAKDANNGTHRNNRTTSFLLFMIISSFAISVINAFA